MEAVRITDLFPAAIGESFSPFSPGPSHIGYCTRLFVCLRLGLSYSHPRVLSLDDSLLAMAKYIIHESNVTVPTCTPQRTQIKDSGKWQGSVGSIMTFGEQHRRAGKTGIRALTLEPAGVDTAETWSEQMPD